MANYPNRPTASAPCQQPDATMKREEPTEPSTTTQEVPMGNQQEYQSQVQASQGPQTSTLAIASLACGIASFFVCGIVLGPVAIVLGAKAKKEINNSNPPGSLQGSGMARAGLICGIISTVLWVIVVIIVIIIWIVAATRVSHGTTHNGPHGPY